MRQITIKRQKTGETLHEGTYNTLKDCLEDAVLQGLSLEGADLRRANLMNAALDGGRLRGACFEGANLMGANLSEACLEGADLRDAGLQNACLCDAEMKGCVFHGTLFGATDIAGADISFSRFDTLSAFTLNFRDARRLELCRYKNPDGVLCPFSRPPAVLMGLYHPVILMDQHIKIGPEILTYEEWQSYANDNCPQGRFREGSLHAFIRSYRQVLQGLMHSGDTPSVSRSVEVKKC